MAYATDAGALTPILMPSTSGDGLLGGGGIGALLIGALLFGGGLGGFGNRAVAPATYGMGGGYVPGVVDGSQSGALSGIQAQLSSLSNTVGQNHIDCELESIESDIFSGFQNTQTLVGALGRDILGAVNGTTNAVTAGNFTTLSSINGLGTTITSAINQGNLQSLNSFNQLNTNLLQGINEVGRDTSNGFNQVIMGQNNQNAIMAQCCCDIKSTITADGGLTRALINDINVQNLQGQLNDAKNSISSLNNTIATQNIVNNSTKTILEHFPWLLTAGNGNGNGNSRLA